MTEFIAAARKHGYLAGLMGMCVLLVAIGLVTMKLKGSEAVSRPVKTTPAENKLRNVLDAAPKPAAEQQPSDKAAAEIESYKKQLENNPASQDTPAVLNAMGNLYRQKFQDYKQAAQQYERIILEFPDWEGTHAVFPLLVTCYEKLNDGQSLNWLYQEMMRRFPEDSQEYLFAKTKLGI